VGVGTYNKLNNCVFRAVGKGKGEKHGGFSDTSVMGGQKESNPLSHTEKEP